MSDQNSQSIKAIVPDSDNIQKNSSHVESVLFAPPSDESNDNDSEADKEE